MSLRITSPTCKTVFQADERLRGKKARCKRCGTLLILQDGPPPAPSVTDPKAGAPSMKRMRLMGWGPS